MEIFKKMGPRVILVELRGHVCGLITVKDVLKYQFKVENEEHPRVERYSGAEERLWEFIEANGRRAGNLWNRLLRRNRIEGAVPVRLEDEVELVDRPS
jgi:chloride channel 3/4/5